MTKRTSFRRKGINEQFTENASLQKILILRIKDTENTVNRALQCNVLHF